MTQEVTDFAIGRHGIPMPAFFPGESEAITINGTSAQTAVINSGLVRVSVSTDCFLSFGSNPTATSSDIYMPAGSIEYFAFIPGEKIAFIQSTASGIASVTVAAELDR